MSANTPIITLEPSFREVRTYSFTLLFVAGNLLLPQLCHLIPGGGFIFLPIYFFTLIAGYKFGLKVGLLTAVLSPLANALLFGMPLWAAIPVILAKSVTLATVAALIAKKSGKVSLLMLALTVVLYQVLGGMAEWALTGSFQAAVQDLIVGWPGMLVQVLGGWFLLRSMAGHAFDRF